MSAALRESFSADDEGGVLQQSPSAFDVAIPGVEAWTEPPQEADSAYLSLCADEFTGQMEADQRVRDSVDMTAARVRTDYLLSLAFLRNNVAGVDGRDTVRLAAAKHALRHALAAGWGDVSGKVPLPYQPPAAEDGGFSLSSLMEKAY